MNLKTQQQKLFKMTHREIKMEYIKPHPDIRPKQLKTV